MMWIQFGRGGVATKSTTSADQIFDLQIPGAMLSSTSAIVLRPHFLCGCTWTTLFQVMKRIRITIMDFRMYFGFMYGILFDGRIITRKTRKSHRNTENIKNRLSGSCRLSLPRPHTESTEINGMHEMGAGAEEWRAFIFT